MCSFHAIRAPSHRSPSHRCLHRRHSHYGYCSPHPCSCGQPARTRKTDKALKVINFATCTCAPPAPARHPHVLRARERAAHLVLAALAVAQHAAEHGSVLPDVAPSTSGCPFSRGFVFHMVPVRVKSNYYSFYRLGSASETVRCCATAAPPPPIALSLSFSTVRRFSRTFSCSFGFRYAEMRCHEHPVARPRSTSAVYSLLFVRALLLSTHGRVCSLCYLLPVTPILVSRIE